MARTFRLFVAALAATGCLALADTHTAFARTKRVQHARDWSVPHDHVGKYIRARLYGDDWAPGYAPHGWFGYDPTASSQVLTGPCWGGECFTYTPGFGPQRQPRPLLP
jgi:hypothetical protein